jgi:predicted O-methyltransferase YrrM
MNLRGVVFEAAFAARALLNRSVDAALYRDPFGKSPRGTAADYKALHEQAKAKQFIKIDALEDETGFAIDRDWLDELALHTQIAKKKSDLAYPHGRLLYSLLRRYIADSGEPFVTVCETGTARGFSALCMAKAISDSGVPGRVFTFDVLPHLKRQYWNCIDDHDGRKSRAELLAPWSDLLRLVTFVHGDTHLMLERVGLERINFAFLDAQHVKRAVLHEFNIVSARQRPGDMTVFDDVTPSAYPGVVAAVQEVERQCEYKVKRLTISESRSYAWAIRAGGASAKGEKPTSQKRSAKP